MILVPEKEQLYPCPVSNGDHEANRRERSQAAARGSATSRIRFAPLRKIVERTIIDHQLVETLECKHKQRPRQPLFGGFGPASRRCLQCLDEMTAKADQER